MILCFFFLRENSAYKCCNFLSLRNIKIEHMVIPILNLSFVNIGVFIERTLEISEN